LALFALLTVAVALVLGFYVSGIDAARTPELRTWFRSHFLVGVFAAIAVILVNSIAITYFIGTSRWCKEVAETYRLDGQFVRRSANLQRRAFPWALSAMLVMIGVIVLGGAADTRPTGTESWVIPHLIGALVGWAFIAISFYMQGQAIAAHHAVIEEIVAEVRRIRIERGLEV
jgi:hypothetical protein